MSEAIEINNVNKVYSNGFVALKEINLKIHSGEIFALLGPNGAEIGRASCRERV